MPIRGSPNGAAHSCPRSPQPRGQVDAIARNRWTPSLGMAVDAINRYAWTSSIGTGGRHHSVRPSRTVRTSLCTSQKGAGAEIACSLKTIGSG
jgi:hypothetical protein